MYRSVQAFVLTLLAVLAISAAIASAQGQGAVRGVIADSSGGALPGVTVTATLPDGAVVATAVTDGAGAYELTGLPAGDARLSFQLDGFVTASESIAVEAGAIATVAKRLELAHMTETVEVVGEASVLSPSRALPPPLPPIVPLPQHDRESVCGPAKANPIPEFRGTIRAARNDAKRDLYTKDDQLIIDGGTLDGLETGQNLAVRRQFRAAVAAGAPVKGEHTAGVVQIVEAGEHLSTAVVVYACDELRRGDFLAAFDPEPVRTPEAGGIPSFDEAARILFADAGQILGAPGRLMVIDRGVEHGIRAGQRVTLFRRTRRDGARPSIVGDAIVVATRGDSATIRVVGATDVISTGDWAAPQQLSAAPAGSGSKPH